MTLEECKGLIKLAERLDLELARSAEDPDNFGFYKHAGDSGAFVFTSFSFDELRDWALERIEEDKAIDAIVPTRE